MTTTTYKRKETVQLGGGWHAHIRETTEGKETLVVRNEHGREARLPDESVKRLRHILKGIK